MGGDKSNLCINCGYLEDGRVKYRVIYVCMRFLELEFLRNVCFVRIDIK